MEVETASPPMLEAAKGDGEHTGGANGTDGKMVPPAPSVKAEEEEEKEEEKEEQESAGPRENSENADTVASSAGSMLPTADGLARLSKSPSASDDEVEAAPATAEPDISRTDGEPIPMEGATASSASGDSKRGDAAGVSLVGAGADKGEGDRTGEGEAARGVVSAAAGSRGGHGVDAQVKGEGEDQDAVVSKKRALPTEGAEGAEGAERGVGGGAGRTDEEHPAKR